MNGSSIDPDGAREYSGGRSAANNLATVSRANPVRLAIALADMRSTRFMRLT